MTCNERPASVKRAVQALDSTVNVDVDLPSKTVKLDTAVQLDAVKSAVEDAGYEVFIRNSSTTA
jgi:copper chaperone